MPKMSCWNLARGYPKVVTQITVHSAEGLEKKYADESKNYQCVWQSKILFIFHFTHKSYNTLSVAMQFSI